jgi:hypothetical protein
MGPLDIAPLFGFILAGPFWPQVYPGIQGAVDRELKRRQKEHGLGGGQKFVPEPKPKTLFD